MINSRLSDGERSDQLERARNGEISIMVGPRSALFTPFSNLGLIIVDEEQEVLITVSRFLAITQERQQTSWHSITNSLLLLGSATLQLNHFQELNQVSIASFV